MSYSPPQWLAELPVWLCWREEDAPGRDKPLKVPYYSGGRERRHGKLDTPEDRARLVTFDQLEVPEGFHPGYALGRVHEDGPFLVGIDYDNVAIEDVILPHVREAIGKANGLLVERSFSLCGFHLVGLSTNPPKTQTPTPMADGGFIEIYSKGRFFAAGSIDRPGDGHPVDDWSDYLLPTKARQKPDTPAAGARVKVDEGGRNHHLWQRRVNLHWAGLPEDCVLDALREINEQECDPPLSDDEVELIARRGGVGTKPSLTGQQVFSVVEGELPKPMASALVLSEFLDRYAEPPHWVVDGILPKGALYALTAMWGHFKTALALLISDCVATGEDFNGHQVAPGKVLYLAGENPHDVALRLTAMFNGREKPDNLMVYPFPFAIDNDAKREAFVRSFDGETFDLVVIDTGPAYTERDEENDNAQAHQLAMAFRSLIQPLGRPCVLVLMHPVKNATKENLQPRGGGAFSGSIDGELAAWAQEMPNGVKAVEFFHRNKFRGPGFKPMTFAAKPVALPQFTDNFGRPARTITLVPEVIPARRVVPDPKGANAIVAWRVINETGERDQKALYPLIAAKLPAPPDGKQDKRKQRAAEALATLQKQKYIALDEIKIEVLVGLGVFPTEGEA